MILPVCNRNGSLWYTKAQTPLPDYSGPCKKNCRCETGCDCGGVACGEYLFDHRNASVREWLAGYHTLVNGVGEPWRASLRVDADADLGVFGGIGALPDRPSPCVGGMHAVHLAGEIIAYEPPQYSASVHVAMPAGCVMEFDIAPSQLSTAANHSYGLRVGLELPGLPLTAPAAAHVRLTRRFTPDIPEIDGRACVEHGGGRFVRAVGGSSPDDGEARLVVGDGRPLRVFVR